MGEYVVYPMKDWRQLAYEECYEEGIAEGRAQALREVREILVGHLEKRFDPLSADSRARLERMSSMEQLMDLAVRLYPAPSLAALGLA